MTEAAWLACTTPERLLHQLTLSASSRKLRLIAVACCRHIWDLLADPRSRTVVELAERVAEGGAGPNELGELEAAYLAAQNFVDERTRRFAYPWPIARSDTHDPLELAGAAAAACAWSSAPHAARGSALSAAKACQSAALEPPHTLENAILCDLLRDITGNPFRPVLLNPAWGTPTVHAIAHTIYQEHRFNEMPILGDALEEAGCTCPDFLDHCRSGLVHARGCWVLDLFLGMR